MKRLLTSISFVLMLVAPALASAQYYSPSYMPGGNAGGYISMMPSSYIYNGGFMPPMGAPYYAPSYGSFGGYNSAPYYNAVPYYPPMQPQVITVAPSSFTSTTNFQNSSQSSFVSSSNFNTVAQPQFFSPRFHHGGFFGPAFDGLNIGLGFSF